MCCPIHNGAPAKEAKLEVEEKRMLGAKSQMHELLEVLRLEKKRSGRISVKLMQDLRHSHHKSMPITL